MVRLLVVMMCGLMLAACSQTGEDLNQPPVPLGDFRLGFSEVVTSKTQKVALSRELPNEMLAKSLDTAIEDRFSRYDGPALYHFGVSIEGYFLAPPGVPLVASPKSLMQIRVTVWDDAAGAKINDKPEEFVIGEGLSGESVVGSGLTQSAEEQLEKLSLQAAKRIETFLVKKHKEDGWFAAEPALEDAE